MKERDVPYKKIKLHFRKKNICRIFDGIFEKIAFLLSPSLVLVKY